MNENYDDSELAKITSNDEIKGNDDHYNKPKGVGH